MLRLIQRGCLALEGLGSRLFLLLFAFGVAVRMALSFYFATYQDLTRYEMERVALSFAHTRTLADPYNIPTRAHSWRVCIPRFNGFAHIPAASSSSRPVTP